MVIRPRRLVCCTVFAGTLLILLGRGVGPETGEAATFTLKCALATINDVQHEW